MNVSRKGYSSEKVNESSDKLLQLTQMLLPILSRSTSCLWLGRSRTGEFHPTCPSTQLRERRAGSSRPLTALAFTRPDPNTLRLLLAAIASVIPDVMTSATLLAYAAATTNVMALATQYRTRMSYSFWLFAKHRAAPRLTALAKATQHFGLLLSESSRSRSRERPSLTNEGHVVDFV